jgi:L-fucose mutarotase/ribose pyranase (RbsD/FucU family)
MATTHELIRLYDSGMSYTDIAARSGLGYDQVKGRIAYAKRNENVPHLSPSTYPVYNEPLQMEGDALVLPDTEFPYHNADFVNRCLDLAHNWGIRQCIIAGDALHFDSLSQWEAEWIEAKKANSLTEDAERKMRESIQALPPELQAGPLAALDEICGEQAEPTELAAAKKCMLVLAQAFQRVDYVIGNHDNRLVRALKSPLMPQSLLDLIGLKDPAWRIAPYFMSYLISGGETYRIEHPRSAAPNTAVRLADKFDCSIIAGHSHLLSMQFSTSGRHYAVMAGACVDETRLAYAAQRSTNSAAHLLGAVLVRDGYPHLLHAKSPWAALKRA